MLEFKCYSGDNFFNTDSTIELSLKFIIRSKISNRFSVDIDTIEIRADEEEGSGAIKARRTYNYKVKSFVFF